MEDLLSVVVFILYLIAVMVSGKKKKKREQKSTRQRMPQFGQAFEQLFESMTASESAEKEKAASASSSLPVLEGTDPCHESMLGESRSFSRYNSVSQLEMQAAGEGKDPCHGSENGRDLGEEESPVYCLPIFDTENREAFAKDVLRGVIMSEILERRSHQRAGAGMKRRT
ncbi:MAG: hypothetical protein IKV90_00110 [Clostridia bacterium]|nr:hypothetical protein [Clostridia bacterium]